MAGKSKTTFRLTSLALKDQIDLYSSLIAEMERCIETLSMMHEREMWVFGRSTYERAESMSASLRDNLEQSRRAIMRGEPLTEDSRQ